MKIKKTLFYTLTGYVALNLASAVNAKECPQLKPDVSQVEIADNTATLRNETDLDNGKETKDRPTIVKGNKLTAINPGQDNSIKSKDNECWYKVESPDNNKQAYWIEQQDIVQTVFQASQTGPASTTASEPVNLQASNQVNENNNAEIPAGKNGKSLNYSLILLTINLIFTILSTAFLWWFINEKNKKIKQDIITNRSGLKSIQDKVIEESSRLKSHNDHNTQQIINKTTSRINQLSSLITENTKTFRNDTQSLSYGSSHQNSPQQYDSQDWTYPDNTQNAELFNPGQFSESGQANPNEQNRAHSTSGLLTGIIECFNKNNVKYFNNDGFILLAPISASSLGNDGISIDAKTKINFQKIEGNPSQAPYLGFTTDGYKTYLIPNLFNGRWKQLVLNNEDKIFEFTNQSLILVQPAELVGIGDGVWRLESPVKFQ
ncbi:MAG: hypothetical protein ACK58N_03540 [Synechocystis sp.]